MIIDRARVERAVTAFGAATLSCDPRVTLTSFGPVAAASDPSRPGLDFVNRIQAAPDAATLRSLVAHYRRLGLRGWLELREGAPAPEGFERVGTHGAFAASKPPPATPCPYAPPEPLLFAQTLLTGLGAAGAPPEPVAAWCDVPGIRPYLVEVDGVPAAAAVLFLHDGVGYLANASTLEAARGRGLQTALIRRRLADASAAGCDLVAALAAPGSTSARNLVGAGVAPLHEIGVWRMV